MPAFVDLLPISHYAYRYLQQVHDQDGLRNETKVFCIENATLSIERQADKTVFFYVFDSESQWIADLSHGVTPFIADKTEHTSGLGIFTSDRFSHSVNITHFICDELIRLYICEEAISTLGISQDDASHTLFLFHATNGRLIA